MPPIPIAPGDPSITLAASGTVPAAGVSGIAGVGPFMVETQSMTLVYTRVPDYGPFSTSHSLSGPTQSFGVHGTWLRCLVEANYSRRKIEAPFDTSSFSQPQTFSWQTCSIDTYGNSYGSAGPSALGPAGTIITQQPWYYRRPWVSTDTEIAESCIGTTNYTENSTSAGVQFADGTYGHFTDAFDRWRPTYQANSFLSDGEWYGVSQWGPGFLVGGYNTSQESPAWIAYVIDSYGHRVENKQYFGIGTQFTLGAGGQPSWSVGCPHYRNSRHSWT